MPSTIIGRTDRPVINPPRAVLKTGRSANVERLRGLPNVIVPRMATLPKRSLTGPQGAAIAVGHGFAFPFLVRAPGFHTGRHFIRVENPRTLAAAADFPGDDLCLIEELDARDSDGFFRKLRVMIIDRKIYPLHLAVSRNWKVHYFRADMAESADNRAHDAAFLSDMGGVVGSPRRWQRSNASMPRSISTIAGSISRSARDGDILFFEANATMVMVPLSDDPKWDYRRPAFDNVFAGVRRMLTDRVRTLPS